MMEKNEEMMEKLKANDMNGLEMLKTARLLCPIKFTGKIIKDKFGNIQTSKENNIIFGMINDHEKSYYLAYTDHKKAKGVPYELLIMSLHDYYRLFCQDECRASGIVINLNSDNIIIDKAMIAALGYREQAQTTPLSKLNIYPQAAIETIKKFAKENRDLKSCYLLNYAKDDVLHFCFIIEGIKPNKLIRNLKLSLKDKLKDIPYEIVAKCAENARYCTQNILEENIWPK